YRPEYQKRKDKICPFSSLAFFQPTTVDKEPFFNNKTHNIMETIPYIMRSFNIKDFLTNFFDI
ncbi:hypothetical protein ACREZK_11170, partial [Streptococcus pneumoniae]